MAVTTTGSLVRGTVTGLREHLRAVSGGAPTITYINAGQSPDGVLTSIDASGLAIDWNGGNIFISKVAGGSTWYKLGSTA